MNTHCEWVCRGYGYPLKKVTKSIGEVCCLWGGGYTMRVCIGGGRFFEVKLCFCVVDLRKFV